MNGGYSYVRSAKPALLKPSPVKAAAASHESVKITWGNVAGAMKYEVYRASSRYGSYSKLTETTTASYTDTGLTTGKTCHYKVRAYILADNTKVYGPYSDAISAKP